MRSLALATWLALALSCGNDNGGAIEDAGTNTMNDGGPDTCSVEATFTSIHDTILSTNRCALPGCHAGQNPGGDLDFEAGKQAVYDALLNGGTTNSGASGQYPDRVVASDSANSYFYLKVSETSPPGGMSGRMPPGPPLQDCQIQAIQQWIDDGAQND